MKQIIPILFLSLTFCIPAFSQEVEKIQEFENIFCEDYLARMDNVMFDAQNNPTAIIYIFVYEGNEKRFNRNGKFGSVLPAIGTAKAKIDSMKKYISKVRRFPLKRFIFVEAGFRENLTVEIWNVPPGVASPKPSPTLTKMRHRKGKPTGFCIGCC